MIRQAHTYLVGALSGVVVIGIAIAAFVVLVSAQVFHDLPIPALSSSDQKAVSQGKALPGSPGRAVANTGGVATGASPSQALADATPAPAGRTGANESQPRANRQANDPTPTRQGTGPAEAVETAPTTTTPSSGGDEGSSSSGGKTGGSKNPQPSSGTKSQPTSTPGSVSGNNPGSSSGTSGGSGPGNGTTTTTSGSSGGAPSTGTSGGGTTTVPPVAPVTTAKPSETVTETVNGTVGTVDESLGGTLTETGVTKVTEEVVEGAVGPESVVGKTVDGVGEVVGGVAGGSGH
jgi:hypothetical protein